MVKKNFFKKLGVAFFLTSLMTAWPRSALALESWGSHVHCYANEDLFKKIRGIYGGSDWYPVTAIVMISRPTDWQQISIMLEAAEQYQMYPILRISMVRSGDYPRLDPELTATILNNEQLDTSAFPNGKLLVIYGNEVNMSKEWSGESDPADYAANFNRFVSLLDKTRYIPIKAPINLSYPPKDQQWAGIAGHGGQEFYEQMHAARPINTYGIDSHPYDLTEEDVRFPGNPSNTCGDWVGQIMNIDNTIAIDRCFHEAFNYSTAPFTATEFGLGPNFPMDRRKKKLEDLYKQFPDQYPGLDMTTPMLLDDIQNPGTLPIIPVFKESGGVEYIDCNQGDACGVGGTCGASGFPGVDWYYLYPLNLVEATDIPADFASNPYLPNSSGELNTLLYNMVVDQGYRAYLASRPFTLSLQDLSNMREYFDTVNHNTRSDFDFSDGPHGPGANLKGEVDANASLENARVPMIRNARQEHDQTKISSIEGYFGYSGAEDQTDPVYAGVAANLTTLSQQCKIKKRNIATAKKMCEMLENPASCAFLQLIPNTNYYYYHPDESQTLLPSLTEVGYSDCDSLYSQLEEGRVDQKKQEIRDALSQLSLSLPRLYRMGYLVIAPRQNTIQDLTASVPSAHPDLANFNDPFYFLWRLDLGDAYKNIWRDAPIFVPFKIPDFATNKTEYFDYQDSAEIVADILSDPEAQELFSGLGHKDMAERRDLMHHVYGVQEVRVEGPEKPPDAGTNQSMLAGQMQNIQNDIGAFYKQDLAVIAEGMPQMGAHGNAPIREALFDIINASHYKYDLADPEDLYEEAGDIYSEAWVEKAESTEFKPEFGDLFESMESSKAQSTFHWGLKAARDVDITSPENEVRVTMHLVVPIGTNMDYITNQLKSMFDSEQLAKMIEDNYMVDAGEYGVPEFYPLKDFEIDLRDTDSREYFDQSRIDECPCCKDELYYNASQMRWDTRQKCHVPCSESGAYPDIANCKNNEVAVEIANQELDPGEPQPIFAPLAKIGWYIRKIQETLREHGSNAYNYIVSCDRTEDLFLGRCGQDYQEYRRGEIPWNGRVPGGERSIGYWQGKCEPITDNNNPCSVDNLKESLKIFRAARGKAELSEQELTKRAAKASLVCNEESSGNPDTLNDGCRDGSLVDYSVGLFQINLLAHSCSGFTQEINGETYEHPSFECDPLLSPPQKCMSGYFNYTWEPPSCELNEYGGATWEAVDKCAEYYQIPENNLEKMWLLTNSGADWGHWRTSVTLCEDELKDIDRGRY